MYRPLFLLLSVAMLLASCGGDGTAVGAADAPGGEMLPQNIDTVAGPSDKDIFNLGVRDANAMLDTCRNDAEIEMALLDTRARIHLINTRVGARAAEDYTKGFVSCVKSRNDTLAAKIF